MAATNQTSNYGLPQWLGSDKLERTDMNTAMAEIDDNLNLVDTAIEALQNLQIKTAYGHIIIQPVADTPTPGAIDYSSAGFTTAPTIVATASSSSAAVLEVSYADADKDGANLYLRRSNTTSTGISWIAMGI